MKNAENISTRLADRHRNYLKIIWTDIVNDGRLTSDSYRACAVDSEDIIVYIIACLEVMDMTSVELLIV